MGGVSADHDPEGHLRPAELSERDLHDDGRPGEACGVFAVHGPGLAVAHLCYLGIFALQHRGQESAGIATSDGRHLTVVKAKAETTPSVMMKAVEKEEARKSPAPQEAHG